MNYTDPFVLREDVLLIPCVDLSDDLRERIAFDEGDFTLSRRHGRALAQVIDRDTAALLELFREPRTIVDAVVENSRSLGKDPEALLEELLPHIGTFVHNRVLVPAGSQEELEIRPLLEGGAPFGPWTIVRCVSLIEDGEIYQLRRGGSVCALKIARYDSGRLRLQFENEAAILRHLDGAGIAPRLIEEGAHEERPYLLMDWIPGLDASTAAAQRRHDRASLLELCASIAAAYAALHARGVLHADVHARNILAGGGVTLLDFGYSRFADEAPRIGRGGLTYLYEPEYLGAEQEGRELPASAAGEQYSVAALLYQLLAGSHYLDFRYEREEMTRQVREDPPRSFAERGLPPWPGVERILFRALEKDPARRFGSMSEIAALLAAARDEAMQEAMNAPLDGHAHALLENTLRSLARGGETYLARYPAPPTASINYGAAGAAMGLLRIAEVRSDPALLSLAALWQSRAATLLGDEDAYYHAADDLTPEIVGRVTPYHTDSGIHAVAAMIAAARGDSHSQAAATAAFLHASRRPCAELDLVLGRLGSVLAATLLLPISGDLPDAGASLRAFAGETVREVWDELDRRPAIAESPDAYLGMAHGWTGYLYATLRWCAESGDPLPARLVDRLHELAELKIMEGRGAYWPVQAGSPGEPPMPGWCNGTAGQLFLFTLADRVLGDRRWLELAEQAAWDNWNQPRGVATLCCGTAGRAYALLNLYRHTGENEWLGRARRLANHAAAVAPATAQRRNALWKGELGVAVLIADFASPENARMPFFE